MSVQYNIVTLAHYIEGPGSSVDIATGYGLDGPGIESRWGWDFPQLSRPALGSTQPPVQWVPGLSRGQRAAGAWCWPLIPSSAVVKKECSYTSTPPMGRTACTEPQCLYKGALYLFYASYLYLFSASLTNWCRFSRTQRIYGEFIAPVTIQNTHVFMQSVRYLARLWPIWIISTEFHRSDRYKISQKSVQWEPLWYMRTDGRT